MTSLVEEWVARLDTIGHGHAVALLAEQEPRELNFVAEIERAVERMPAAHAIEVEAEILVSHVAAKLLPHVIAVVARA